MGEIIEVTDRIFPGGMRNDDRSITEMGMYCCDKVIRESIFSSDHQHIRNGAPSTTDSQPKSAVGQQKRSQLKLKLIALCYYLFSDFVASQRRSNHGETKEA